jgi:hypothetical protein
MMIFVNKSTKRGIWMATTEEDMTAQQFAEIINDVYF